MMRVLVTGASGLIGRWSLKPLVESGADVHTVQRRPCAPRADLHSHPVDLHDPVAMERLVQRVQPTHLLHFAWVATPGVYLTSVENQLWVHSSLRLVDAFLAHGGRRVVIAGSIAEYDWSSGICREHTTPCRPSTLYGACKHAVFEVLEQRCALANCSFAEGRLVWVYGPGEAPERLVPAMVLASRAGEAFPLQYPKRVRDYLHVTDAGEAFAALLRSEVQGPINVGSGDGITLERFAELIGAATGAGLIVNVQEAVNDPVPRVVADVTRLTEEVGWKPRYHPTEGIRETVAWWQTRLRAVKT
jgi:nucleoside-diphosphate-sugar epimerase